MTARRTWAFITLSILLTLSLAVPGEALVGSPPPEPTPSPAVSPADLAAISGLRVQSRSMLRKVTDLVGKVDRLRVSITSIRIGIRSHDARLHQRKAVALRIGAEEESDSAETAIVPGAKEWGRAIRRSERAGALLTAEIRYQRYQSRVIDRRLVGVSTELRALDFELGRRAKQLDVELSRALRTLHRVGAAADALPGVVSGDGKKTTSRTIAKMRSARDRLGQRKRALAQIESEVATTLDSLNRHRARVEVASDRAAMIQDILADRFGFLFPFDNVGESSTTTGGACKRSVHSGVRLSDAQIAGYARAAGFRGFDLAMAVATAVAESGGDPQALCVNYSGSRDEGLWQINTVHGENRTCTFDPSCNAEVAFRLYKNRGNEFVDWVAFNTGSITPLIPRGAAAALLMGEDPYVFFKMCPVDPPRNYSNDFGDPRYGGGYHPHGGNDIFAPRGTPIRAPFDGIAVASNNGLGGKAVTVYGTRGYVYNAHLLRFGRLGPVSAGRIIGYVGNSGNARTTPAHDHFEFHPADGVEINPFPYLNSVCLD